VPSAGAPTGHDCGCWQGDRVGSDGGLAASAAGRRDFFVSHASRDQTWAEWLAWQLTEAGYTVELDMWDWAAGQDFVAQMRRALDQADRMLAVYTPAYFAAPYAERELHAAFTSAPPRRN
jgi:hypothetical protein